MSKPATDKPATMTRAFLQEQYIISKQEKEQKELQTQIEFIKSRVLTENENGKTYYTTHAVLYQDTQLNEFINKLKEIFTDCEITVKYSNEIIKANVFGYVGKRSSTIKIDWTPLKKE